MAQRTLLCVEPDEATVATIRAAVEPYGFDVTNIGNGEQAVDWAKANRPELIIVSVEPRKVGYAVCNKLKRNDDLKRIPVVVMTTSRAQRDILKAYNAHANCYVTKPLDMYQFIGVVKEIQDFWLTVVKLPAA